MRAEVAEGGGGDGDEQAEGEEDGETSGEEKSSGRGDDQHRNHDDGADRFEGRDGGQGGEGHEKVVHELGSEALEFGKGGIERREGEFFVKKEEDQGVEEKSARKNEGGAGDLDEGGRGFVQGDEIEGGLFERAVENAVGVEIDAIGGLADEDEAEGKQGSENNAHRGTAFHFSEAGDPLGEEGGEKTGHDGTHEDERRGTGARDQKGDAEAGEDGVTDGVTHHAHAAKEEEGAGEGTGGGAKGAHEDEMEVVSGEGHFFRLRTRWVGGEFGAASRCWVW